LKVAGHDIPESYRPGAIRYPPYLTPSERARFIRGYYQVWGMMKIEPSSWPSRLACLKLKDLFRLYEMTKLNQSIGGEETIFSFQNPNPGSIRTIRRGASQKRLALEKEIWQDICQVYQEIFDTESEPDFPWILEGKEIGGYMNFIVIWDHWEFNLKCMSCRTRPKNNVKFKRESFWNESSDGEFDI